MSHGIPAAVIDAAERGMSRSYKVPDSATWKGSKATWTEVGRVLSLKKFVGGTKKNPSAPYTQYEIGLEMGPEGSGSNIGRKITRTSYINNDRILQGPPPEGTKDGQWTMCMMTTRLLIQLATALGIPAEELFVTEDDGSRSISSETIDGIFTGQGTDSPYVGHYVGFSMSQEIEYEDGTKFTPGMDISGKREKNVNTDFNSFFDAGL